MKRAISFSPAPLPAHDTRYRIVIVPGLFGECIAEIVTPFAIVEQCLPGDGGAMERPLRGRGPFEEQSNPLVAAIARGHVPFPRGVLLEAIVLYVAESANATAVDE